MTRSPGLEAVPSVRPSVLITGAGGTIGSETVRHLAANGWRVVGFARQGDKVPDVADTVLFGNAAVEGDIAQALDGVDAVVHLAALPHWEAGTPYDVFTTNVVTTFNVLTQSAQRGIQRVVIASSIHASGIPGNHRSELRPYYPIDEELALAHDEWYSLSKYTDERTAAMVYSRWKLPVIAFRFPLVGSRERLLAAAAEWNARPEEGVRVGWAYLDVRDAAEAIRLGLETVTDGAQVMQLAAPQTLMTRSTDSLLDEYAPHAERRSAFPGKLSPVDTTRAQRILGFSPRYLLNPTQDGGRGSGKIIVDRELPLKEGAGT